MSTSAVVRFIDEDGPLCAFYRHGDGGSMAKELKAFYIDKKLVTGLSADAVNEMNGFDDLAAQTIAFFKKGPGGVYMTHGDNEGDYTIDVYVKNGKIIVMPV